MRIFSQDALAPSAAEDSCSAVAWASAEIWRASRAVPLAVALAVFGTGCQGELDPEPARQAAIEHFNARYTAGRMGILLKGHAVWLEAPFFQKGCLESKDLAFNDDPNKRPAGSPARISPTYEAQRWLSASTDGGFCVYLGTDPKFTVDDVSWGGDRWRVTGSVAFAETSPWYDCLENTTKSQLLEVKYPREGPLELTGEIDLKNGDCPQPLPKGWERTPKSAPTQAPRKAPDRASVLALVQEFDAALDKGDHSTARELTSCWNLFEKGHYGSCALGDFVAVGPAFPAEERAAHGTPWLEYSLKKPEDIGRITADRLDKTIYHVAVKHKRTGADRSFSVQFADGAWKMMGVIGQKSGGITAVRYLNDLHRKDRRDLLVRRLAGEAIDHEGNPLDPNAPEEVGEAG